MPSNGLATDESLVRLDERMGASFAEVRAGSRLLLSRCDGPCGDTESALRTERHMGSHER